MANRKNQNPLTGCMTVADLIAVLSGLIYQKQLKPSDKIILSCDEEGNGYGIMLNTRVDIAIQRLSDDVITFVPCNQFQLEDIGI